MRPHKLTEAKRAELFKFLEQPGASYAKAKVKFKIAISTIQLEVERGGWKNPRTKKRSS